MLHFVKFRKTYGSYLALAIEDLTLAPGIYWVKGVNGSGKSTLLKAAASILPFAGDIALPNQISLKKHRVAYRRSVNFAEAEPVFPEFLTGREIVRVFAAAKGGPAGQEQYLIESMAMQPYIHQPIRAYSSGMIKKLSLALAFLGQPQIILLDEPLITLDTASLAVLYTWIAEAHQRGISFLISSHQDLAEDLPAAREILVHRQTVELRN